MSDFKQEPDTGTMFKNKFKNKDSHPDYTGTYALPDGTLREFAAWINQTKVGDDYLSIRFSDRYDSANRKTA